MAPLLLRQGSLAASGIEVPSPIQESAIPVLLGGANAAVQSYTGSGKVRVRCGALALATRMLAVLLQHEQLAQGSSNQFGAALLNLAAAAAPLTVYIGLLCLPYHHHHHPPPPDARIPAAGDDAGAAARRGRIPPPARGQPHRAALCNGGGRVDGAGACD